MSTNSRLATLVSGARTLTGDQLELRVRKVAAGLRGMGLVPGQTIAILMRNDFPFIEIALGAERVGVTAVPLNWHGSLSELHYILKDAQPRMLFAHADLLRKVLDHVPASCELIAVNVPPEVVTAYGIATEQAASPPDVVVYEQWLTVHPEDHGQTVPPLFRLLYTSGSTGHPKGVIRLRGSEELTARLARMGREAHGLEIRPVRAVIPGPLYHSAPYSYALNCVRVGELLVLQPKFDAQDLLNQIERHRISHLHVVPAMFNRLLDLPEDRRRKFDCSSLRAVAHGAAMCPADIKRAMIDWWGPIIVEYYAATETGIITRCTSEEWLGHPGTVGCAPPGVRLRVVDESGQLLAPGVVGEIQVASEVVQLVSYRNQPEATDELRNGEWISLGDIGYLSEDGYLWICDRKNDLIISGGVNIYPAEVERCLCTHPAVRDAVAFGIPDGELGEVVAVAVELSSKEMTTEDDLKAFVRAQLGSLRVPQQVKLVDRLPREDSGKLARRKVRSAYFQALA